MEFPPCNYYDRSLGIVCGNLAAVRVPGKGTGNDPDGLWCFEHAHEAPCDFPDIEDTYLPLSDDEVDVHEHAMLLASIKESA